MSITRDTKQERIIKTMVKAQRRLDNRIRDIEWEEDYYIPLCEAMKAGKPVLGLPSGNLLEFTVIDNANSDQSQNADPAGNADGQAPGDPGTEPSAEGA